MTQRLLALERFPKSCLVPPGGAFSLHFGVVLKFFFFFFFNNLVKNVSKSIPWVHGKFFGICFFFLLFSFVFFAVFVYILPDSPTELSKAKPVGCFSGYPLRTGEPDYTAEALFGLGLDGLVLCWKSVYILLLH